MMAFGFVRVPLGGSLINPLEVVAGKLRHLTRSHVRLANTPWQHGHLIKALDGAFF